MNVRKYFRGLADSAKLSSAIDDYFGADINGQRLILIEETHYCKTETMRSAPASSVDPAQRRPTSDSVRMPPAWVVFY